MTSERDPDHWLHRLTSAEWLRAAANELGGCRQALAAGERRRAVAYARRAAGMALNGVLSIQPVETWGRSYMDHLHAVASDAGSPDEIRQACRELLAAPLDAPRLVRLGGAGDDGLARAAERITRWCEDVVGGSRPVPGGHGGAPLA